MPPSSPTQSQEFPPTLQVRAHRGLERWLARGMGVARALGLSITSCDPDSVLAEARRKTGLDDWGDDRFLEPMRQMLGAVERCAYTVLGSVLFRGNAVRAVTHRLQIEAFFAPGQEGTIIHPCDGEPCVFDPD